MTGSHRRAFTVAVIGPDGAGKTAVATRLPSMLGRPAAYLYMGVNPASSNRMLPSTRIAARLKRAMGHPPDTAGPPEPRRPLGERARTRHGVVRSALGLANQLAEEWYRQLLVWWHLARGEIVVLDRHFLLDFHAYDVDPAASRTWRQRVHGAQLDRLYPRPDLTVYLDAPGAVLHARKGEGSVAALERRRRDYLRLADVVTTFEVVDAARPCAEVLDDVVAAVRRFARGGEV